MKGFFITILLLCAIQGYTQNSTIYFDDRDSNGTGLVLYSNGIFVCDYRYYFLKSRTRAPLYYSRGTWHPIDTNIIELKSFEEYKPRIINTIAYNNPQMADSVKIFVYNTEGELIGYAYLDGNHEGETFDCFIEGIFVPDPINNGYLKTKDIIYLPYNLTYKYDYYNQYYFVISTQHQNNDISYHNCVIRIDSEKKHYRVIEEREFEIWHYLR